MKLKALLFACCAAAFPLAAGCGGDETTVKPMQEYREDARQEVTEQNAEDQLRELTDEIEADQ